MLPDTENYEEEENQEDLTEEIIPDQTYLLNLKTRRIGDFIDGEEAKEQAVMKILFTEAETAPVYDAGYGRRFEDLYGKSMSYALSEAKNRIEEAILQDDRFESVEFTAQTIQDRTISLSFMVNSVEGEEIEMEGVDIHV